MAAGPTPSHRCEMNEISADEATVVLMLISLPERFLEKQRAERAGTTTAGTPTSHEKKRYHIPTPQLYVKWKTHARTHIHTHTIINLPRTLC